MIFSQHKSQTLSGGESLRDFWWHLRCNCCIFWSGCHHHTPTQDHWTWNFGSSVCIGFDMAVGRREPREVQGWVLVVLESDGVAWWGVWGVPTRPYVLLEPCHLTLTPIKTQHSFLFIFRNVSDLYIDFCFSKTVSYLWDSFKPSEKNSLMKCLRI